MPQYELSLREYWQVIQKRRLVLIIVFFAVLVFSIIYTNMQQPVYEAASSIQWIEHKTLGSLLTDLVSVNVGDPLIAQSKIITSLTVLEKVVIELGLVGKDASPNEVTGQAISLQGNIAVDIITGSNVIRIVVKHQNPQLVASIANKIAEVYITENLRVKSKQSRTVREFIEKQLEEISTKLKNSEEALAKFKEIEVPSGIALALQDRLADLETQHQNLLGQYTQMHPSVKDIEEQISQVKERLKVLPRKELQYARLIRDTEINTKLYRELKDKLEGARIAEAEKIEDVSLVDRAVMPGSPISPNKSLNYSFGAMIGLILGLTMVFLAEQLDTTIGTIEDVENYLKLPVVGVIPYLKTKDEKKEGFIQRTRLWPKEFKGKEKILRLRNQLLMNYSSSSPIFEAYRILRTNIQNEIFKGKIQGNVLLLSSSGPEEGKSITISNLSIVAAQAGLRTLLIDADMRRAQIHNIFGMDNNSGLFQLLSRTVELKGAIKTFTDILINKIGFDEQLLNIPGIDNLNILLSGSLTSIPAELLASPEMDLLLKELRNKYDLILVDTPPVLAVADAVILAPKTDGIILIYRVGKTARSILLRTKTQLETAGVKVKGIVLNNMSPEMELRYGYYYHYKYYGKYYTSDKEQRKVKE